LTKTTKFPRVNHPALESYTPEQLTNKDLTSCTPIVSERKHVTVLFSDLTGYTAMSERLDPEEVKDITKMIFNDITKIITKYEGFVEKFAGDAVMALFGPTEAHEDDPVSQSHHFHRRSSPRCKTQGVYT
jgi:class 3 adenylate cyclase